MNIASRKFSPLDPRCFKAFVAVAQFGHFTLAAERAAMTQSSVSQHVAKLERQLGLPLFTRTARSVILTETGQKLLLYITRVNDSTAEFFEEINHAHERLEGLVRCCMPPSCVLSSHFARLLERSSEHPGLELQVDLARNDQNLENVINGEFDFGIVTEMVQHVALRYQTFCREEYILVARSKKQLEDLDSHVLLQQKFISYPCMGTYFNFWVHHHMTDLAHLDARSLSHAGEINSIVGAISMVVGGLGISVFPRHCVQRDIDAGMLYEYTAEESAPLLNDLYIVRPSSNEQPRRVEKVIEWFVNGAADH
jgi:DNA-binding transcriptional LysR family regulator